jgi:hypothetical protein
MTAQWDRPPEFEPDGTPPPLRTDPLIVATAYAVRTADSGKPGDPLVLKALLSAQSPLGSEFKSAQGWLAERLSSYSRHRIAVRDLYRLTQAQQGIEKAGRSFIGNALLGPISAVVTGTEFVLDSLGFITYTGLLRLRLSSFWQRHENILQLPPNDEDTVSLETTVGMSRTESHELGQSLGLEMGGNGGPKLSSTLSEMFRTEVTYSEQRKVSQEVRLTGPTGGGKYRHYALWRSRRRVEADLLVIRKGGLAWERELAMEYLPDDTITRTYVELPGVGGSE